mgnify:CR=1 FL=1
MLSRTDDEASRRAKLGAIGKVRLQPSLGSPSILELTLASFPRHLPDRDYSRFTSHE